MQYKNITDIKFGGAEKAKSEKLRACEACCKLIKAEDEVVVVMYTYKYIQALDPILNEGRTMSFDIKCIECGKHHLDLS